MHVLVSLRGCMRHHKKGDCVPPPSIEKCQALPFGCLAFVSGRQDSNLRPPGPKPGALPDCATPRAFFVSDCKGSKNYPLHKRFSHFFVYTSTPHSFGCWQMPTNLSTNADKFADKCRQACRQMSAIAMTNRPTPNPSLLREGNNHPRRGYAGIRCRGRVGRVRAGPKEMFDPYSAIRNHGECQLCIMHYALCIKRRLGHLFRAGP